MQPSAGAKKFPKPSPKPFNDGLLLVHIGHGFRALFLTRIANLPLFTHLCTWQWFQALGLSTHVRSLRWHHPPINIGCSRFDHTSLKVTSNWRRTGHTWTREYAQRKSSFRDSFPEGESLLPANGRVLSQLHSRHCLPLYLSLSLSLSLSVRQSHMLMLTPEHPPTPTHNYHLINTP